MTVHQIPSGAARAAAFYDPVLAVLGIRKLDERDGAIDYCASMTFFCLEKPSNKIEAVSFLAR